MCIYLRSSLTGGRRHCRRARLAPKDSLISAFFFSFFSGDGQRRRIGDKIYRPPDIRTNEPPENGWIDGWLVGWTEGRADLHVFQPIDQDECYIISLQLLIICRPLECSWWPLERRLQFGGWHQWNWWATKTKKGDEDLVDLLFPMAKLSESLAVSVFVCVEVD